jgi:DNA-binding NtrC family response regulator
MESEFFGHRKGSFTGAHADKAGLFQAANGGTLFLDEVAELPLQMQVKLLRAIQERSVRAVGANAEVSVDVRILSASNRNLGMLVEDGRFRHDLYYRLNVIELRVPPLRERTEDLPGLVEAILGRLCAAQHREPPRLGEEALDALRGYPFPGNVRELENILERALALAEDDTIDKDALRLPAPRPPAPGAFPPGLRDPPASTRARPPAAPCPATSRKSSATPSSRRSRTTSTTRPRPPPSSASPSAPCATSSRSSASTERPILVAPSCRRHGCLAERGPVWIRLGSRALAFLHNSAATSAGMGSDCRCCMGMGSADQSGQPAFPATCRSHNVARRQAKMCADIDFGRHGCTGNLECSQFTP